MPLGAPLLPPDVTARTYAPLLANPALQVEEHRALLLPQWLADRFGWSELAGQAVLVAQLQVERESTADVIVTTSFTRSDRASPQ